MLAIFKKEVRGFFDSSTGYLIIGFFLTLNGLFLWVFKGPYNIFDYGFADLQGFFQLAPWVFLFLIPAITMRSFSEERKLGTLELLLIKPISKWQLVSGKFLGAVVLALIALLPTLLYVYCIDRLGNPMGNLDLGMVTGSYFGTIFLIACYAAIGVFASALSENQIVAFIIALIICFLLYYGMEGTAALIGNGSIALIIKELGMKAHFESIARGVIDTRDLVYFMSVAYIFLFLTVIRFHKNVRR